MHPAPSQGGHSEGGGTSLLLRLECILPAALHHVVPSLAHTAYTKTPNDRHCAQAAALAPLRCQKRRCTVLRTPHCTATCSGTLTHARSLPRHAHWMTCTIATAPSHCKQPQCCTQHCPVAPCTHRTAPAGPHTVYTERRCFACSSLGPTTLQAASIHHAAHTAMCSTVRRPPTAYNRHAH